MIESNILLKKFILDAPVSSSKHSEAIGWLSNIHKWYKEEIGELKKEIEELKSEKDEK